MRHSWLNDTCRKCKIERRYVKVSNKSIYGKSSYQYKSPGGDWKSDYESCKNLEQGEIFNPLRGEAIETDSYGNVSTSSIEASFKEFNQSKIGSVRSMVGDVCESSGAIQLLSSKTYTNPNGPIEIGSWDVELIFDHDGKWFGEIHTWKISVSAPNRILPKGLDVEITDTMGGVIESTINQYKRILRGREGCLISLNNGTRGRKWIYGKGSWKEEKV